MQVTTSPSTTGFKNDAGRRTDLHDAEGDTLTPPSAVLKAAQRTKSAEVMKVKGGHFDVYLEHFEVVSDGELKFLKRHLG
jgi:hypothetical protein